MVRRVLLSGVVAALIATVDFRPLAAADVTVLKSTPVANAKVAGPNVAVDIQFSAPVDHAGSRLTLATPDNKFIPLDIVADAAPDHLAASAKGVAAGAYRLRWHALGEDGKTTHGEIPFTVGP
ncbi:MAG TPA: copper resistance CopC family protein [Methylomirabilota bacterium]|nr:copper resistance CopC family protein [Methylomirabilota bacterium]